MAVGISLTEDELAIVYREASRRQAYNESKNFKGRNRAPTTGPKALEMHVLGCVGEIAVAKYLDLIEYVFQKEAPVRGCADLPGNIEVKTRPKHHYDLLIQLDDNPEKTFVLVTCESHESPTLVGWIQGKDAMKACFVREYVRGRPCYSIPASKLNPVTTLSSEECPPQGGAQEEHSLRCLVHDGVRSLAVDQPVIDWLGCAAGEVVKLGIVEVSGTFILRRVNERTKAFGESWGV